VHDPRSDELLDSCGRTAARHRFALAWTDSLDGPGAKACSRGGSANWKRAQPLSTDENAAASYFRERARKRNPVVVASASGLVLVEFDGPARELLARHSLPVQLPPTICVRSRRGVHLYFKPPTARTPMKVQLGETAVTCSSDGYLVTAPAIHPSGLVYEIVANGEVAELPVELYDRLVAVGEQTREGVRRSFEAGEPIPVGQRDDALFSLALQLTRDGLPRDEVLARLLDVNREQCSPPLDEDAVRKQLHGALKWSRTHLTETERLRTRARAALDARGAEPRRRAPSALIVPMREFLADSGGEADWLVDHLIARYTMSLVAGLPKVGKSTFVFAAMAAITRAGEFLGLPVRNAAVLLLTEESPATVEEKVERFGIDESRIYVLPKRRARGKLRWAKIVDEAVRFCEAHHEIEVCVVDTVDKFADLDAKRSESDTGVIRETVDPLYALLALGVGVVLITHQRKEPGEFGIRVRGGTSLTGSADIIVEVERVSTAGSPATARVLKLVSRFTGTPDEIAVDLDGDSWTASGTLSAAARRWKHEAVLALLDDTLATLDELHANVDESISKATLRRRLEELVDDGQVESAGEGVKGDPRRYRLSQGDARIRCNGKKGRCNESAATRIDKPKDSLQTAGGSSPGVAATNGSAGVTNS
jgi:hypothetical protein